MQNSKYSNVPCQFPQLKFPSSFPLADSLFFTLLQPPFMIEKMAHNFAKTICSICYEDLNPIIEDLQSVSICGHVFHELCLQQWFEYCKNGKKKNCPVCKQRCSEQNATRLYFQSVGDTSLSQTPHDYYKVNPQKLQNEVKRLEGLTSTLEQQLKDMKGVSEKLFTCKEELKMEATLKNEAVEQKEAIQQLLRLKSEELDRSTLECIRLQDRNMAVAKELAALKLSYEEVLSKCDTHGRREARALSKLGKAKEKINKLKARAQELEKTLEEKEKEISSTLKASKKNCSRCSYENQNKAPGETEVDFCLVTDSCDELSRPRRKRKFMSKERTTEAMAEDIIASSLHKNNHEKDSSVRNKDGSTPAYVHEGSYQNIPPLIILDDDDDMPPLGDITQCGPSFCVRKETSVPVILTQPGDSCFSGGLLGPDGTKWHLGKWCKKAKDKGSG